MAEIRVGVVDVFVVSKLARSRAWRVLVLRRAQNTRCPGSWETVHGRIRRGETPHDAAVRELREETGLAPERLYNVTTHGFYLQKPAVVEVAVAFCAFVDGSARIKLGAEHDQYAWMPRAAAIKKFAWPRERECMRIAYELLSNGDAGAVEDVLRVF